MSFWKQNKAESAEEKPPLEVEYQVRDAGETPEEPDVFPTDEGAADSAPPEDRPLPEVAEGGSAEPPPPLSARLRVAFRRLRPRRLVAALLLTALYLLLAVGLFSNAAKAGRPGVSLSLRYNSPLDGPATASARRALNDPKASFDFSAAFWAQKAKVELVSAHGETETPALLVDGDMGTVLPVEFLYGGYPGALETTSAALSEGLAWSLLGGTDVVGTEFTWGEKDYQVRGVFKGEEPMLLVQIDPKEVPESGFSGVELAGNPEGDPREAAKSFLLEIGLPEADVIWEAGLLPGLITALAWLPVIGLCGWFLIRMLRLLRHLAPWKRQLVWLGLLLAAAWLLPKALDLLPGWMIPTRWSDFAYWGSFLKEMNTRFTQWLALTPYAGDVQLKKQLIWAVVLVVPELFVTLAMAHRWTRTLAEEQPTEPAPVEVPEEPAEGEAVDILTLQAEQKTKTRNPLS